MERWPGSRTGDFLEDGKGVPCRGRRDLDGDLNPGQGDFLTSVCRDEKVLGLRHNGLPLRGWTALVCRFHLFGGPHYIIERLSAFTGWCSFVCSHDMVVAQGSAPLRTMSSRMCLGQIYEVITIYDILCLP